MRPTIFRVAIEAFVLTLLLGLGAYWLSLDHDREAARQVEHFEEFQR